MAVSSWPFIETKIMNLTNQLLIAQPGMPDERFSQAVILICEHNEHGAMGINVNALSELDFDEILAGLDIDNKGLSKNQMIYEGGDRKSTRLNSSHVKISYAVFCLKKKK